MGLVVEPFFVDENDLLVIDPRGLDPCVDKVLPVL
jgi:hypothetical protein